jgi:O-antigen ligase
MELILINTHVKVITGVKADVYVGMLCAFTLAVCILAAAKNRVRATLPEMFISFALLTLGVVAGLASSTPWSSTVYVFVFAGAGLGGFWCARVAINTPSRQKAFVWLCALALAIVSTLGIVGHYFHDNVSYFSLDTHLLTNAIFLLSFGPLALLTWRRPFPAVIGGFILILAYVTLYILGVTAVDTAILAPMVALALALLITPVRTGARIVGFVLLLLIVAVTVHYLINFSTKQHFVKSYNALRLEYYPFSWHIAQKSPLLGLGLRTPKEEYLADYEVWNPYLTKSAFYKDVARYKVCQNMFLTLMVGLGLPFAILYAGTLLVLIFRLVRAAARGAPTAVVKPIALLVPLTCGLIHLMVMDLLLMPYLAWFFHILMGLIPKPEPKAVTEGSPAPVRSTSIIRFAPVAIVVIIVGAFLGTHPALDPKKLPSRQELIASVKTWPIIAPFFEKSATSSRSETEPPGELIIKIQSYTGTAHDWAIMCILDNSISMARTDESWRPNRLEGATEFLRMLSESMQAGSKIGVRGFIDEAPLRRRQAELQLRVSRVLCHWMDTPAKSLELAMGERFTQGENNVCAATELSLQRDFWPKDSSVVPRTLLLTDGSSKCPAGDIRESYGKARGGPTAPVLDVAAFGMKEATSEFYAETVREANGVFMKIDTRGDIPSVVSDYITWLGKLIQAPVVVSGESDEHTVEQGTPLRLPPGEYTVILPETRGLDASDRRIANVVVTPGQTKVLNVSITDGKLTVEE